MIGRRSIIGLCMLCALAVSGFAAQSASAALTGTTAVTCKEVAVGAETTIGFKDAHCKEPVGNGTTGGKQVKFEHKKISKPTDVKLTNIETGVTKVTTELFTTVAGVELVLSATGVEGTGTMENSLVGEEHRASGSGTIVYTGVKAPKPSGAGGEKCIVKTDVLPGKTEGTTGVVDTESLTATTAGAGMGLKFEPTAGANEPFARFWIVQNPANAEKCPAALAPKTWTVVGNITSTEIKGATTLFTKANTEAQKTLRFGGVEGPVVGISGTATISGREKESLEAYTPIAATTTGEGEGV